MMPATNQNQLYRSIFNDLDAEERMLLEECTDRILRHVDKNIEKAAKLSAVARLLTFRWLLSGSIQKIEN